MASYQEISKEELLKEKESLLQAYEEWQKRGLTLNMARGKPSAEQLDLAYGLLNAVNGDTILDMNTEIDTRNYGGVDGIKPAKELIASMVDADPEDVIVYGNSSLNMMFDTIGRAMMKGICGGTPWCQQKGLKWLCPAPGYDRHFGVTEYYGFELITIPMHEDGPDMDMVEKLVSEDEKIKGIWCVPKYSNPTGITFSDETVRRFAKLKPAAPDFRIMWDNAYIIHDVTDNGDKLLSLMDECKKNGTEDMPIMFTSTSKITFPGSGVSAFACSENNMKVLKKRYNFQTIGFDKINMLRHALYLKDSKGLIEYMKKHKALLAPKFECVLTALDSEVKQTGTAKWETPNGGYFVSVDVMDGTAKEVVRLCKEAGVVLTGAGATYPYGKDPKDSNIRIAPSFPCVEELEKAMQIFCVCVKLAAVNKLLA